MPRYAHDPVAARLVEPELTHGLRRFLGSKGIPAGEVDEILGVARMQLLERGLPATPLEATRLLFRIAGCRAIDWHREQHVKLLGERSVHAFRRPRGQEPELPCAPVEVEEALLDLEDLASKDSRHARAFEAMKQKMAGKPFETFAAESGVAPGTLRQWVRRFRAHARKHLPEWANGTGGSRSGALAGLVAGLPAAS